jgi:hypothetical protein
VALLVEADQDLAGSVQDRDGGDLDDAVLTRALKGRDQGLRVQRLAVGVMGIVVAIRMGRTRNFLTWNYPIIRTIFVMHFTQV